jgi:aryl-alcohol dehydrogenase-like predicted oxidoreductase
LGTNTFSLKVDEAGSLAIVNRALELGINYIDTADVYGRGGSEELIGRALKGRRSQVILATKFGKVMGSKANERGASRYYILAEVEASLRRLQTDYIDLYQYHRPDDTPIEETLRALDDAVRAGKVRYVGCSNFAPWQLCQAVWTSRANNLNSFVSVQPEYSLLSREIEILELGGKIKSQVESEMSKTQREYFLREQLKAIQRELGESDEQTAEVEELRILTLSS